MANTSRSLLDLGVLIKFLLQLPVRLLNTATTLSKNALYMMTLVLFADYLYLRNQILKRQYKQLTGRLYVPLHNRLGELVGSATYLSLPSPNTTRSIRMASGSSGASIGGALGEEEESGSLINYNGRRN
ncbi:predicted protein [Naegleria gruberi]|uniref:Predicted protein n=1 Tax=Naegleria gruberi TaxID=5762 RepID=D2W0X2_NAEGR|nr:uncharacterized protein NAEGRDRAFT_75010 [Naegleria gruberi]EFC37218.1 predicted protein [Naegleria gruberi]|eukprot:XP_002669962.1 predicted protein [Naegleria gruberi strain NEG-M]